MPSLLRIDASPRQRKSLTRMLSNQFLSAWKSTGVGLEVMPRDVGLHPPAAISESWIDAAFTSEDARSAAQIAQLESSEVFIDEVQRADIILIATPMYNYGMPAALKAWIDQVVRINKTFSFDLARGDRPLEPILDGKTLVLLTASGEFGFGPGELNGDAGHLVPHIRTVSKYLGAGDLRHIGIEYQEFGDDRFEKSKTEAIANVEALSAQLAERHR